MIFMFVFVACVFAFASTASADKLPALLIVDTDLRGDCDDAGALAVAHYLANTGEAELIGVITSTTGDHVVAAAAAINHYYGRPDIPVGLSVYERLGGTDDFAPTLADTDQFPSDKTNATAPNSTALYRELLHNAPRKVTIAVIGNMGPISEFLNSPADYNGDGIPKTGMELAKEKAGSLVIMAGHFTNPGHDEANVAAHRDAAQNIADNWPGKIVYSGWEIGNPIMTGSALSDPEVNPVAMAYKLYRWTTGGSGTIGDRHSWDQTAVLYAVRGLHSDGEQFWSISPYGKTTFNNSDPYTEFTIDSEGLHRYLIEHMDTDDVEDIIEAMMTAPPKSDGDAH